MTLLLLGLLACADKELAPLKGALEDYERGRAQLAEGNPAGAAEAFAAARKGDPTSPVLALWEARARAAGGDLAAAETLATEVIVSVPEAGLAWYNRAAWRMRLGRADEAAADLRQALTLGVRTPYEAAIDPDFALALGTPAFAELLPPGPVYVKADAPAGAVFVGGDVTVVFEVIAAPAVTLALRRSGADPGCLRLEGVVEEEKRGPGLRARRVELRMRGTAACAATLHFEVAVASPVVATVPVPPILVQVEAPSSFAGGAAERLPTEVPLPGTLASADGAWAGGRLEGVVWAMGRADESPRFEGRSAPIRLELRADGETRAAGGAWISPSTGTLEAGEWRLPVAAESTSAGGTAGG